MITTPPVKGQQAYTVLRAICMAGQRVEPGQAVTLTPQQAVELAAAGKVSAAPIAAPTKPDGKHKAKPDTKPGTADT